MNINDSLTIILPLKGRVQYTKRLLDYCELIDMPFQILIADGGEEKISFINKENYPNLRFEYIKFPYDYKVIDFNKKMSSILKQVKTPYTMLVDNDDFFCIDGICHQIEFLNKNRDYANSRGKMTECALLAHNQSKGLRYIRNLYWRESIIDDTVEKRVKSVVHSIHSHWHDIVRTKYLQITHKIIDLLNTNDFKLQHRLNTYLSVIPGKVRRDNETSYYYHQASTERTDGNYLPVDKEWIKKDYWEDTIAKMISAVGIYMSKFCDLEEQECKRYFCKHFIKRMIENDDKNHRPDNSGLEKNIDKYVELSNLLDINDNIRDYLDSIDLNIEEEEIEGIQEKYIPNLHEFINFINRFAIK